MKKNQKLNNKPHERPIGRGLTLSRIWDEGTTVYIIGGGPSIAYSAGIMDPVLKGVEGSGRRVRPDYDKIKKISEYLAPIHNQRVIGVNNSYMLGNWVDVVWFGDCGWFNFHQQKMSDEYFGLRCSCCPRFGDNPKHGVYFFARDNERKVGISTKPNRVAWNHNSGSSAINVAYHLGATRIVLLGFDMKNAQLQENKSRIDTHWHGGHKATMVQISDDTLKKHLEGFPYIAKQAPHLGLEIINAVYPPLGSGITSFRKVSIDNVLKGTF